MGESKTPSFEYKSKDTLKAIEKAVKRQIRNHADLNIINVSAGKKPEEVNFWLATKDGSGSGSGHLYNIETHKLTRRKK